MTPSGGSRRSARRRGFMSPIVPHVIHRLAPSTLSSRRVITLPRRSELPTITSTVSLLADRADPRESGSFEDRVRVAHGSQRLDPGDRARRTRPPDEIGRDAGPPIGRMNHDPRQEPELLVERRQSQARPCAAQAEIPRPHAERRRGRCEYANADRLRPVLQKHHALDEAELVSAIVPPGKLRPVARRAFLHSQFAGKRDRPRFARPLVANLAHLALATTHP